jgi:hypothetical protein
MIKHVIAELSPIQEKRAEYEHRPADVSDVLTKGNQKAQEVASRTMDEVRAAITL